MLKVHKEFREHKVFKVLKVSRVLKVVKGIKVHKEFKDLKVHRVHKEFKDLKESRVHLEQHHLGLKKQQHILQLMEIKSLQIHLVDHLRSHYPQLQQQDL